jgi:uncharacterized protein (TIGR02246 family)
MIYPLLSLSLLCFLLGCGLPAPSTVVLPAVPAGADSVYARFSRAYRERDPETVRDLYTPEALYLQGEGPIQRGQAMISQGFTNMFSQARSQEMLLDIQFRFERREARPDVVIDVGYYLLSQTNSDGHREEYAGKFVTVLQPQADEKWRFVLDSYTPAPVSAFYEGK